MTTRGHRRRVLYVEDEFLIRLSFAAVLSDEGFEVVEAESGDEALALLPAEPSITLLVTDINLPGSVSGLALAQAARRIHADLPVIYLTGRLDGEWDRPQSVRDIVIQKPCLPAELVAAAHRLLGGAAG